MSIKKFTENEIREAIIIVFGSIDNYAKTKGVDKANIYQKISRQSPKFIKELKDNGITIGNEPAVSTAEIGLLKKENESLKKTIKDKELIIELLTKTLGNQNE